MTQIKRYNYKGLCDFFGEEPASNGGSRKKQIERWKKQFHIEKIQHKNLYELREYNSKEVRETKDYYSCKKCIEPLLYQMLLKENVNNNSITKDMGELMYELCLINDNYNKGRYNKDVILNYLIDEEGKANITLAIMSKLENDINNYYYETYKIIKRVVIDVLNKMVRDKSIFYTKTYGKIITDENNLKRKMQMTNSEISTMITLQKDISNNIYNLEYADLSYYKKKNVDKKVCEEMNITDIYDLYNIILNQKGLKMDYDKLCLEDIKGFTNRSMVSKINLSRQGTLKDIQDDIQVALTKINIDKNYKKINFYK